MAERQDSDEHLERIADQLDSLIGVLAKSRGPGWVGVLVAIACALVPIGLGGLVTLAIMYRTTEEHGRSLERADLERAAIRGLIAQVETGLRGELKEARTAIDTRMGALSERVGKAEATLNIAEREQQTRGGRIAALETGAQEIRLAMIRDIRTAQDEQNQKLESAETARDRRSAETQGKLDDLTGKLESYATEFRRGISEVTSKLELIAYRLDQSADEEPAAPQRRPRPSER